MTDIAALEYDDQEFEVREVARMELDTFDPDEVFLQILIWIETLEIPEEDKMEIEATLRQEYRLNPGMFNIKEGEV